MSPTKSRSHAWIPWVSAPIFGMFAGYGAWLLVFSARTYCDAGMEAGDRFGFWYVELPEHVVGYGLCALVLHGVAWLLTFRAPTALRVCVSMALVVTTLTLLAWWYFKTEGTLDGSFSDSGLCPPSNIPPWWPAWIPA
ncbi:hypothetical protein ACIF70_26400 [Actinacidiphila glaucinigra]|uniref:hypothetical protein n=1 Tax=Actinacidiphila glaucinigra TaxID=235986 RepID=UPI002DDA6C77|nr:hypothetical protein [Actinacidiphila glaucinigra]WSD62346.1 hypothetical protein OIE69_27415 [Actinacidiphila glaucinigra]